MRRLLFVGLITCGFLTFEGSRCSAGIVLSWGTYPNEGGEGADNVPGEELVLSSTITGFTFSWLIRTESGPTPPFNVNQVAYGEVYILTSPYTGDPSALSTSTPGFVAVSTSNNSDTYYSNFVNSSSVAVTTLAPGTYYFYATAVQSYSYTGSDYTSSANGGVNDYTPGQVPYSASGTGSAFSAVSGSHPNNYFELTGSVVPEPATLLPAVFAGMLGFGYTWRRSRKAGTA